MDDLLSDFLTETNESLAELDVALITLERTPDDAETLRFIFRLVHTIKGTCGFLGLPRLERVAHAGENVLGKLRDRTLTVTPDIVSQVLAAIDRIKAIVTALSETGAEPAGDDTELIAALNADRGKRGARPRRRRRQQRRQPVAEPAPQPVAVPVAPAAAARLHRCCPGAGGRPRSGSPQPAAVAAPAAAGRAAAPAATVAPAATQTIRVTVDVLEDLMTLVSELVLTRNQLLQLARNQENSAFTVPLQRLSHITSDLQEGVMKTRMQPIGIAWNKLPRLVRDLSHDMGKKIELTMLGRRDRARSPGAGADQGPADAHDPQQRRSWAGNPGGTAGRRQAGNRQHRAECLPRRRLHHPGNLRRRPRPGGGPHPRQGAVAAAWRPRPNWPA